MQHHELYDRENALSELELRASILGVGPWKHIVRKHVKLTWAYVLAARLNDEEMQVETYAALVKQVDSWTHQFVSATDRETLQQILLEYIELVKQLVDRLFKLQREMPADLQFKDMTLAISNRVDKLANNTRKMREFWSQRSSITRHKATADDYERAWSFHINCTLAYIKAWFNMLDPWGSPIKAYERCLDSSKALGAVFNGQPWKEPDSLVSQNPAYMCEMCDQSAVKQCNRCKSAMYCSVECQAVDWEAHSYICSAQTIAAPLFGLRKKAVGPQPFTEERNLAQIGVFGMVFKGKGKEGDFVWMIRQPEYAKTLFIFNDNQEQFLEFHRLLAKRKTLLPFEQACRKGSGNAAIRPYQCKRPPRAAGIPTGGMLPENGVLTKRGYKDLSEGQTLIDRAINYIRKLIMSYDYDTVLYSKNEYNQFGTGIFEIGEDVERHIRTGLETRLRERPRPAMSNERYAAQSSTIDGDLPTVDLALPWQQRTHEARTLTEISTTFNAILKLLWSSPPPNSIPAQAFHEKMQSLAKTRATRSDLRTYLGQLADTLLNAAVSNSRFKLQIPRAPQSTPTLLANIAKMWAVYKGKPGFYSSALSAFQLYIQTLRQLLGTYVRSATQSEKDAVYAKLLALSGPLSKGLNGKPFLEEIPGEGFLDAQDYSVDDHLY